MNAFDRCWAFLQRDDIEGGAKISNDPDDRGGLTRYGISQKAFPTVDIRNLTEDGAKDLFRRHYWDQANCDKFPTPVAIALADSSFNQGVATAIKLLQTALKVEADGMVGKNTIAAVNRRPPLEVVNEFLSHRALRYSAGQEKFRRGWFLRLFRLKDALAAL